MTATKVIGESVKQTNRTFIKSYVEDYAKAITENYRRYHINTLNGNLHGNYPEYAREQLDAIENGTANLMKFKVYTGKRYYKIVQQEFETWEGSKYYQQYRDGSVHCFVDKEVAIKRETPTKCWSMAQILEAVKNQFGVNALAEARRYMIQDVFNLKDRQ